jgi:hypothetical protein
MASAPPAGRRGPFGINNRGAAFSNAFERYQAFAGGKWPARFIRAFQVGVVTWFTVCHLNDDGAKRAVHFLKQAFPIYADYQWTQFQTRNLAPRERAARLEALHEKHAPRVE